MKNLPLVSIVILHYNRISELLETLDFTNKLDYPNIEIILVDNGSKKEFVKLIEDYNKFVIKKIFISPNRGSAYGHTIGMKKAKGKYVLTIDDDSYIAITALKVAVKILEKNNNLGAIGFGMINPLTNFDYKDFTSDLDSIYKNIDTSDSYESMVATSASIFRNSCLEEVGYYDLNWNWYTEDTELLLKIIYKNYNTINLSGLIAYHKSSLINRNLDLMLKNSIEGTVLLYFKFFPLNTALYNYTKILYSSLFNSLLNLKIKYFFYALVSPFKIINVMQNRMILSKKIRNKVHIPGEAIFSRK